MNLENPINLSDAAFNNSFIFFHNSQQTKAFPTEVIYLTVNIIEEKYHWYALSRLHLQTH